MTRHGVHAVAGGERLRATGPDEDSSQPPGRTEQLRGRLFHCPAARGPGPRFECGAPHCDVLVRKRDPDDIVGTALRHAEQYHDKAADAERIRSGIEG